MTSRYRETLRQPGMVPFLWTQFLGAFNDNLFKMIVSMVAVHAAAGADAGRDLSLVGAVFILPFLLFSGYAGQLADTYSKRSVLVVTKALEIVAAGLGLVAFIAGRLEITLVVLFLLSLQATFFSPAKYGILPEILPERDLSRANGVLEMSTFVAIVAGAAIGSFAFDLWRDQLWVVGVAVVLVALVGAACSLRIPHVAAAAPGVSIGLNPWREIGEGLKRLRTDRVLWLTVVGISYFWFLGALLQLVMVLFGTQVMRLDDRWVGVLTAFAAVGIGVGSLVAGRLSGDKVELGLAPIGSIGMGLSAIVLSRCTSSFAAAATSLTFVGFFGGLFAVPLNALLQQRSGDREKGRLMATNNFMNVVGILCASGALWLFSDMLELSADHIILIVGALTLASSVVVLSIVPEFLIRFSLWLLTHSIYRIRIVGQEHVPSRGPALLVCNHLSHVDGFLVGACVQRFIRFMVYRPYCEFPGTRWLCRLMNVIPVSEGNRRDVMESIARARAELEAGHVVCIFAEGGISRTGNLLPFKRGYERIVAGLDVPVVPVCLDRLWGSIFSFKRGRFFWKWPERLPYPVTVAFGAPLRRHVGAATARLALMELASRTIETRLDAAGTSRLLHRQFARNARRRWRALCMSDSTGRRLTRGRTLTGGVLLARWLRHLHPGERTLGVLLPPSVGAALVNLGATLAGRVPVNLNFTAGPEAMKLAIEQCQIRTIVTSRAFVAKVPVGELPGLMYLEDLLKSTTAASRAFAWLVARRAPVSWLDSLCGADRRSINDLATVIFSSGSTGIPKGVMLSHRNIGANIEAMEQLFWVSRDECLLGVLPFFHSFGFTGTFWFPLIGGFPVVYHPNPMDAKAIGELVHEHKSTMLISTPTFYNAYLRRCTPEQFASLRLAVVGAEKLREPLAVAFKEKFGLELLEGYGCTEMAPVVSVNIPDVTDGQTHQVGTKRGSVGHPLPGVVTKVVDPDTGEGPLFGTQGLLLMKGPNLMLGYLGQPDKTREAVRDGWYVTGDLAIMDEDGFLHITDRLSRFSKIGGEMVPHMKIEECINAILSEHAASIVTSVPDDSRGERLVAFYTDQGLRPQHLWERLSNTDLPRLWLPKREDLHQLEAIPTLGTGKVDLRAVRALAIEREKVLGF
jgi:acyl-[acyl-carrier-protein]-phospholipid O-acyltransferase/long-chain-fatty-acid--[acyl-carrier-protein] ligase